MRLFLVKTWCPQNTFNPVEISRVLHGFCHVAVISFELFFSDDDA
jgi:hypothetical protein